MKFKDIGYDWWFLRILEKSSLQFPPVSIFAYLFGVCMCLPFKTILSRFRILFEQFSMAPKMLKKNQNVIYS